MIKSASVAIGRVIWGADQCHSSQHESHMIINIVAQHTGKSTDDMHMLLHTNLQAVVPT